MQKAIKTAICALQSKLPWVVLLLTNLFAGWARAGDFPSASPENLGFDPSRLEYIDRFYRARVDKGELAGIVLLIARHGKMAHFSAVGYANVETKQELTVDSLFRLYSMTKPIASTALMILYQEGRFQMNDPLSKYLPEFGNLRVLRSPDAALDDTVPLDRSPTIQDLLRHTAGLSNGYYENAVDATYRRAKISDLGISLAESVERIARIPLLERPGKRFIYSVGPDVVARLVEVLSDMSFEDFLQQRLFKPLGMKDTSFVVPAERAPRVASVHWLKDGKLVPMDDAHGYPGGPTTSRGWSSINQFDPELKGGSSGLIGTTTDYWRFAQMILNGGELDGVRVLSPRIVQYMMRDHLASMEAPGLVGTLTGTGFGLGFAVTMDSAAAGYPGSEGSIFWSGAAATHFWIDPKEDMVIVAMSQHMSIPGIESLGSEIPTLVYGALME